VHGMGRLLTYSLDACWFLGNAEMKISREELKRHEIPVALRDYCAHLVVPLLECRKRSYWLPWYCEHEAHEYEVCQYKEYLRCVERKKEMDQEEKGK